MKNIIIFNCSILVLFGASYLLDLAGFGYFRMIFGLLFFGLAGINIGWILEGVTKQRYGMLRLLVWSLAVSPIATGLMVMLGSRLWGGHISEWGVLGSIIGGNIVLALAAVWANRNRGSREITKLDLVNIVKTDKIFWIICSIIVIFLGVSFVIYRYIPEYDGYYYIINIKEVIGNGAYPNGSRSLFYGTVISFYYLTKISLYWVFKIVLPLIVSLIFIPLYMKAKKAGVGNVGVVLISLLPFTLPVISQEILYTRPQSIFILSFVMILYLLSEILGRERKYKYFWELALLLLVAISGVMLHEMYVSIVIIAFLSTLVFFWPEIKKRPILSFVIGILIVGALFVLLNSGTVNSLNRLVVPIKRAMAHPVFDIWFIDSYRNVSGTQMGWPGLSWVYYYGYNLGILVPIVILYLVWKKRIGLIRKSYRESLPFWMGMILFFVVAEILPRMGLAYLPDRAWLFLAIALIVIIADILATFDMKKKTVLYGMVLVYVISFFMSWSITYAKGGWTTRDEYKAAKFIKENTTANAIIISQRGNYPMISYFGERVFANAPKTLFTENNNSNDMIFYRNNYDYNFKEAWNLELLDTYRIWMRYDMDLYLKSSEKGTQGREIRLQKIANTGVLYEKAIENLRLIRSNKKLDQPVYILYSSQKFNSLYGKRQWWKNANAYGATLEKFDNDKELYTQIYNRDGIKIWKVNLNF